MRKEFPRKIRAQAFERSLGLCEGCSAKLKVGECEYDHVLPAELGGPATLANCQVLCKICHRGPDGKTGDDVRRIRKADRQRDKGTGAMPAPKQKIQSAGFPKRDRPAPKPMQAARRSLYRLWPTGNNREDYD